MGQSRPRRPFPARTARPPIRGAPAMNNEEFAHHVLSQVPVDQPFEPTTYYDPDGDCIEFIAAPDSYYAERIDTLLTVYRSQETHEIIGSLIKGVSKFLRAFLQRAPGF